MEAEYRCDKCGKENDFVEFKKARRVYISCSCGYEWEKGTSKTESTCPQCGNYQHPVSARDFLKGNKPCWYCFHKRGEDHQKYLNRKRRAGNTE